MDQSARTRLMTALVLVVVFGTGILLGLAAQGNLVATPAVEETVAVATVEEEKEPEPERLPMYEKVGPSETQRVLIDSIVTEHRLRMDALHEEFRAAYDPRYDALVEEARAAIRGVFTPEQAAEYQRLTDERDRRRAERDGGEDRY